MDESSLRAAFEERRPALQAWGNEVRDHVVSSLGERLSADKPIEVFLKVWPVMPRVKGTNSFARKALYRNKPYSSPLDQITDQVGVRFVTLLSDEISIVESVVLKEPIWIAEKSRDFEEERESDPLAFGYQSLHYVVAARDDHTCGGVKVSAGTTCEIQIRTLLQHAYSELSHDAFYKPTTPGIAANSGLRRQVARSMALIETTDLIFSTVMKSIADFTEELRRPVSDAGQVYENTIGPLEAIDFRLSDFILAHFRDYLPEVTTDTLAAFLNEKSYMVDFIRKHAAASAFFAHPVSLIISMLIEHHHEEVLANWPLEPAMLTPIYAQLGIAEPC